MMKNNNLLPFTFLISEEIPCSNSCSISSNSRMSITQLHPSCMEYYTDPLSSLHVSPQSFLINKYAYWYQMACHPQCNHHNAFGSAKCNSLLTEILWVLTQITYMYTPSTHDGSDQWLLWRDDYISTLGRCILYHVHAAALGRATMPAFCWFRRYLGSFCLQCTLYKVHPSRDMFTYWANCLQSLSHSISIFPNY